MNTFNVTDLPDGFYFTEDAYLDKKYLLLTPGVPIGEIFKKSLRDWEFAKVYSEGHLSEQSVVHTPISLKGANLAEDEDKEKKEAPQADPSTPLTEEAQFAEIERIYYEYQDFIAETYTRYATRKELQLTQISNRVKDMCDYIKTNKRFVLRIQPSRENREKNYLVIHSMRSTVFAIVIGLQLKFPIHKLIELGVTCILHEIGMIRLPPQLYMGNKVLTPVEKNAILTHPVISYNILREFSFPLNICLGVLEHHERENGEGYPRRLTKEKISIYAKIIAVACSYEAVTAPRPLQRGARRLLGHHRHHEESGEAV